MKLKGICPIIGLYLAFLGNLKIGMLGRDITSQNRASRLSSTIFDHEQDQYHMDYNYQVTEFVSFRKMARQGFTPPMDKNGHWRDFCRKKSKIA
jgi:hypothetical protein